MCKGTIILLFFILLTSSYRSTASRGHTQILHANHGLNGVLATLSLQCLISKVGEDSNDLPGPSPLEEESEDEDNTTKDNAFEKLTPFLLSVSLQQQFQRQSDIYKNHHIQVQSPPPRS